MKFLYNIYGTANIPDYPQCINQIILTHKDFCYRRQMKWKKHKLVLATPSNFGFATNTIALASIDPHYDHIVFADESQLHNLRALAKQDFTEESYTVFLESEKKDKTYIGGRGQFIHLPSENEAAFKQCLDAWFSADEIYYLQ